MRDARTPGSDERCAEVRSRDGLRAVGLSLAVLLVTSILQGLIFVATGSVALLADLIHNFGTP